MNNHPDIELLLKYSNGQLKPALSIAIGLHHHQCKKCQATIADIESIAGNKLDCSIDTDVADNAFEKLMDDLASEDINLTPSLASSQTANSIVEPETLINAESKFEGLAVAQSDLALLSKLENQDFEGTEWKRVTNKISQSEILLNDESFKVELLKFKPNAKIPQHTHIGNEFTLVVKGNFKDCFGEYERGEFIQMGQENEHQPIAGKDGCICLAITDRPLKFTGFLGPVINWMAR
jgi:putative transcriptional regulator